MASTSVPVPTSPAATAGKDVFKEHGGLCRSNSSINLCKKAGIRRSYSDNHLCYSVNCARCESTKPNLKNSRPVGIFSLQISGSIIPDSLKSFLHDPETSEGLSIADKDVNFDDNPVENKEEEKGIKRANWVDRLLEVQSLWKNRQQEGSVDGDEICDSKHGDRDCDCDGDGNGGEVGCVVNYGSDQGGGNNETYDRESFSKLLVQVAWSDTKLFSQLAFLCNMAYVIPELKGKDLKRYYGLEFVTSSVEKKAEVAATKAKLDQDSTCVPVTATAAGKPSLQKPVDSDQKRPNRSSVAYEIAASAASYVQSRTKYLLSPGAKSQHEDDYVGQCKQPENEGENLPRVCESEVAAYMAASTMTAVVAAGEKEKQEAAMDLQSVHSSPCEWFVCDDSSTYTRCFVIQGSDSLASWLANLFFEPTRFEDTDGLVHRGIYEAAKGIYQQFLPEIMDHLNKHGDRAKFQFTGHSLGGSLSLLVNLMLLTRRVVKPSALRPVVTFGSPFVFCGGQKILKDLGLDESHIHSVMMHRDIVPRAFSCKYPNHVSLFLKRLTSFRTHPCLIKNKLLYSPLGKLFILQPNETSSPSHPLLPPGNALYVLDKNHYEYTAKALEVFLNCPHPVETLSDPTAYGSEGTILRDHDSSNYLKAINGVLRQHKKMVPRKLLNERTFATPWPLLFSPSPHSWNHDRNFQNNSRLLHKEVMTGV